MIAKVQNRKKNPPEIRLGRPRKELAGEVDVRILDAARGVFLKRGLAGSSIDEIAELAHAGKPTIYARFPNKEALFAAVVMRDVTEVSERFKSDIPAGTTIEECLVRVGNTILHWALAGNTIDLMRVSISEARRFPDLATDVQRMARQRGQEAVSRLLAEVVHSDPLGALPAFAAERLPATTQIFIDLIILPMIMRALFGEKLSTLRPEIEPHVADNVVFFLAGCRNIDVA